MIKLEGLYKTFALNGRRKVVANNINATFPSRTSVALLGRNGAGKSSLLRMIAGTIEPDRGHITSTGSISWPVGFAGSFHPELTGLQNVRFIARIYGVDTGELVASVRDFANLGDHFDLPVRSYSSGMRSRLAFGVSMGIDFDTYLVDEVTSVGDAAFREKSMRVFNERMRSRAAIVVTHSMEMVKRMCSQGAVLDNGHLTYYANLDDAIKHHLELAKAARRETAGQA